MTTIRKIITSSLSRLNAVSANSAPTADDVTISLSALNTLIDSMSNSILNIHTISPQRYLLEANKQTYILGPEFDVNGNATGADWIIDRPMRIEQAVLMAYPTIISGAQADQLWHFPTVGGTTLAATGQTWTLGSGISVSGVQSEFGGNSLRIEQGGALDIVPSSASVEKTIEFSFWSPASNDAGGVLFDINRDLGINEISIEFDTPSSGTIAMRFSNSLVPNLHTILLPLSTWVKIALVVTASDVKIFQDGVLKHTSPLSAWSLTGSAWRWLGYLRRGGYNYNSAPVYIDEYRISSFALYSSDYTPTDVELTVNIGEDSIGANQGTMFLPLQKLTYNQFASLTVRKLATTWPTVIYDDGKYPVRNISVWPVPQSSLAIELWMWEPLATYETIDDELNLPPGYERYLILKLAMEIAPEFGKTVSDTLRGTLAEAEAAIKTMNQTDVTSKPSQMAVSLSRRTGAYAQGDAVSNRVPRVF